MALIGHFGPPKRLIKIEKKGLWEIWEETYTNRDDFDPKISRLRHKKGGK
jgi:hypothetical protein